MRRGTQINVDAGNAVGHGSTLMQAAEIIHAEALVGPRHQRDLVLQEFEGLKVKELKGDGARRGRGGDR